MQATGDSHDHVTRGVLPEAYGIFHDAAALDTGDDVLGGHTAARNHAIICLLSIGKVLAARLLVRLGDLNAIERETHKAEVLKQFAALG